MIDNEIEEFELIRSEPRAASGLKPFARNPGTVTAGNASGLNDGAAAVILASAETAKHHGLFRVPACSWPPRPCLRG